MADISDVENALVGLIAEALQLGDSYLSGASVASPVAQVPCAILRGWPATPDLRAALAADATTITVFSGAGATRRTTRYLPSSRQFSTESEITITAEINPGSTSADITFNGTSGAGQVIGIRVGIGFSPQAYAYRPQDDDDLTMVASAFAALIPGATSSGPTLTVPDGAGLIVRILPDQTTWVETRRQDTVITVTVWSPVWSDRDAVASAVDAGLANLLTPEGDPTDQFGLPDGSSARILYVSSHTDDGQQQVGLWRRDLRYLVEYPTTLVDTNPEVIFAGGTVTSDLGVTVTFGDR